jgi:SpoVK/Ycf46/Vps4 family AAA+-type ATPase
MEKFNGILIATTNKKEHLDEAFNRRFLFKIKLSGITQDQREKMVKHSPILRYLSPALKQELLRQEWNPGQWTNAEKKIVALCDCIEITPEWIEEIFRDEGMLTPVKRLGFASYSPSERSNPKVAES